MKIDKITPQIAAMYLGQKCDVEWLYTDTVDDLFETGDVWYDSPIHGAHITRIGRGDINITPYLRRLDSITEDEARELWLEYMGDSWNEYQMGVSCLVSWFFNDDYPPIGLPVVLLWLLNKGFDLFSLIDAGLAKDVSQKSQAK